jgi:hypothetical protein
MACKGEESFNFMSPTARQPRGRHIPNTTRKNPDARQFREARENWDGKSPLIVSWQIDNSLKTVTKTFYPPFTGVDREADYERAYTAFMKRYG